MKFYSSKTISYNLKNETYIVETKMKNPIGKGLLKITKMEKKKINMLY